MPRRPPPTRTTVGRRAAARSASPAATAARALKKADRAHARVDACVRGTPGVRVRGVCVCAHACCVRVFICVCVCVCVRRGPCALKRELGPPRGATAAAKGTLRKVNGAEGFSARRSAHKQNKRTNTTTDPPGGEARTHTHAPCATPSQRYSRGYSRGTQRGTGTHEYSRTVRGEQRERRDVRARVGARKPGVARRCRGTPARREPEPRVSTRVPEYPA